MSDEEPEEPVAWETCWTPANPEQALADYALARMLEFYRICGFAKTPTVKDWTDAAKELGAALTGQAIPDKPKKQHLKPVE